MNSSAEEQHRGTSGPARRGRAYGEPSGGLSPPAAGGHGAGTAPVTTLNFRSKVLLTLALLVAAAQLASTVAVLYATDRNALQQAGADLAVGARVLAEQLETRTRYLQASVEALVADVSFRHAVAADDTPTLLQLILERTRVRAGAGILLLVGPDGRLRASTSILADRDRPFPFPDLLGIARERGSAAGVVVLQEDAWQVVLVPVNGARDVHWVCMGFRVDDGLARELEGLTGVHVSFHLAEGDGPGRIVASTLSDADRRATAEALARRPLRDRMQASTVEGTDYLAVERMLTVQGDSTLTAVLQSSVTSAYQDFAGLRVQLVMLSAGALLAAMLLAVVLARRVTRPVHRLVAAAERVATGDYAATVDARGGDEFGLLARTFNDMLTGIARREARILHQARHDALTDLPNRVLASDRLQQMLADVDRGRRGALLMVDLVQLRDINETLGYATGDRVLMVVAERLRRAVGEADTVARVGGDEFLVLLADADEEQAMQAAGRLSAAVRAPLAPGETPVSVQASVGVALFPAHGTQAEDLLRHVEEAMNSAVEGAGAPAMFDPAQGERRQRRLAIIRDLEQAIAHDQLALHFQPKLDLASGEVRSCEALVRWIHPELGFMAPDEFIRVAEQSGSIRPLTRWVIDRALRQVHDWRARGVHLGVAVNLSALDLLDDELPALVDARLGHYDLPGSQLTFEITESAVMRDTGRCVEVLDRLRVAGLRLAIDDFGVGYSSLAQLRRLPVDELKIDRSFVHHMLDNADDEMIVRATNQLAHQLRLKTVAEGVETQAVLARLRQIGCDSAQGYLLARPLTAPALEQWLAAGEWRALAASGGAGDRAVRADADAALSSRAPAASTRPSPSP